MYLYIKRISLLAYDLISCFQLCHSERKDAHNVSLIWNDSHFTIMSALLFVINNKMLDYHRFFDFTWKLFFDTQNSLFVVNFHLLLILNFLIIHQDNWEDEDDEEKKPDQMDENGMCYDFLVQIFEEFH